jgi:hypothetical protein
VAVADAARGLSLPPGDHRLAVTGKDVEPVSRTITVKPEGSETVPLRMVPALWSDESVNRGQVVAPDLSRIKLHHQLAYAEHRPEQRPDGDANHRFERGLCVVKAGTHLEQRFHTFLQKTKAETGCACEIVGRASAGSTWSVLLREENGDRSVEVILDTEGRVRVVGDSWKDPAKVKELLPWTAHPAVHKARRSTRSCCWSAAGRSRYTSTSGPSASR